MDYSPFSDLFQLYIYENRTVSRLEVLVINVYGRFISSYLFTHYSRCRENKLFVCWSFNRYDGRRSCLVQSLNPHDVYNFLLQHHTCYKVQTNVILCILSKINNWIACLQKFKFQWYDVGLFQSSRSVNDTIAFFLNSVAMGYYQYHAHLKFWIGMICISFHLENQCYHHLKVSISFHLENVHFILIIQHS